MSNLSPILVFLAGIAIILQCLVNYQIVLRIKNPYIGLALFGTNTITMLVGFYIAGKYIQYL